MASEPVAKITDAEMLDLSTMKIIRFSLLMNSGIGSLLDKLDPVFSKLSESKLDRRLSELQGSKWTMQEGEIDELDAL